MERGKREKRDISVNTVLILLILTILISAVSTWVVLDTINSIKSNYMAASTSLAASASQLPQQLPKTVTQGQISVNVVPNPNK